MKPKALDIAAAVTVLILALLSALPFILTDSGGLIEIAADGDAYTLPLDTDTVHIIRSNGHELTLMIENSSARITESTCPDGLCAAMGTVEKSGETVVCLPARVVIRVLGGEEVLDGIAG